MLSSSVSHFRTGRRYVDLVQEIHLKDLTFLRIHFGGNRLSSFRVLDDRHKVGGDGRWFVGSGSGSSRAEHFSRKIKNRLKKVSAHYHKDWENA